MDLYKLQRFSYYAALIRNRSQLFRFMASLSYFVGTRGSSQRGQGRGYEHLLQCCIEQRTTSTDYLAAAWYSR